MKPLPIDPAPARGAEESSVPVPVSPAGAGAPPIDVKRLSQAMDNLYEQRWGAAPFKGSTTIGGAYAEDLAAEYDRLGAEE